MNEKKNWSAMSIVCVIQAIVCAVVLLGILIFKMVGGDAYEKAASWYQEAASNTVLVYSTTSEDSSND